MAGLPQSQSSLTSMLSALLALSFEGSSGLPGEAAQFEAPEVLVRIAVDL